MERDTRFCQTSDGVHIAYATFGQGPPLVITPQSWVSIAHTAESEAATSFHESLAQRHTVVEYDRRGVGLSDRDHTDFTLEAQLLDLEAVVNAVDSERFALLGMFHSGPVAIAYAARHPERVSRLLLCGTYARGPSLASDEIKQSILSMIRSHWGMASRTLADLVAPGAPPEAVEANARNQRASVSGETAALLLEQAYETDVTDLLPDVAVPAIVIHRTHDRAAPFRLARELSALLPNARLATLEGNASLPWFGDSDSVLNAIEEFLRDDTAHEAEPVSTGGMVTILFTDMEASTATTQRLGDAGAQELLRTHNTLVRDALAAHGGREIKHTGDGIMASFPLASGALECAIAIQSALAEHNAANPQSAVRLRIGLNAGEPVAEDDDLFGTAVQLASRICDRCEPGEILASDVVRQLTAGKGFEFDDRGSTTVKGFDEPIAMHALRWRASASEEPVRLDQVRGRDTG